MDSLTQIRKRHIFLMQRSYDIIGHVLKNVPQTQAATLRDGPEGWTVLEVLGHLRDFDTFFYDRAVMMLSQDYPDLPAYDHESLAIERNYNGHDLGEMVAALGESRQRFVAFFKGLTEEQWARAGVHPERGHFTMTDAVMQVGLHDVTHLEQITRILAQQKE